MTFLILFMSHNTVPNVYTDAVFILCQARIRLGQPMSWQIMTNLLLKLLTIVKCDKFSDQKVSKSEVQGKQTIFSKETITLPFWRRLLSHPEIKDRFKEITIDLLVRRGPKDFIGDDVAGAKGLAEVLEGTITGQSDTEILNTAIISYIEAV